MELKKCLTRLGIVHAYSSVSSEEGWAKLV